MDENFLIRFRQYYLDAETDEPILDEFDEIELGPLTLYRIGQMAKAGEIDQHAIFYSERKKKWLRICELMFDLYPVKDLLREKAAAGITKVKWIDSGTGKDCAECSALNNQVFDIVNAPKMPPEKCNCLPWCRCIFISTQ